MANSIKKVSDTCFRCLLDAILAQGSVTIKFTDTTVAGDLEMAAPDWQPHELAGAIVSLQDNVQVDVIAADDDVVTAVPISVIKSGTTHLDFAITLTNSNVAEGVTSPDLEVYVTWGGH